jgi:hypothetical protein
VYPSHVGEQFRLTQDHENDALSVSTKRHSGFEDHVWPGLPSGLLVRLVMRSPKFWPQLGPFVTRKECNNALRFAHALRHDIGNCWCTTQACAEIAKPNRHEPHRAHEKFHLMGGIRVAAVNDKHLPRVSNTFLFLIVNCCICFHHSFHRIRTI